MNLPQEVLTRHPRNRSQRYLNLSTRDILWIMLCAFAIMVLSISFRSVDAVVVIGGTVVVLVSMINLPAYDERLYWVPVVLAKDLLIRKLRKRILWQRGQKNEKILPPKTYDVDNTGLIVNKKRGTIGIVITAPGSPIASLDLTGQKMYQDLIAECIKAAAGSLNEPVQFSFGFRARPENPFVVHRALAERGEPKVVYFDETQEDTPQRRRFEFLHRNMADWSLVLEASNDVLMYVYISVRSPESIALLEKNFNSTKKQIERRDLARMSIMRLRNTAISYFQRRIEPSSIILDAKGVERFMRGWEVVGVQEYYEAAEARWTDTSTIADQWQPQAVIAAGSDYVYMDGTYAATLKLTHFPVSQGTQLATPFQGRQLYNSRARWHATSVIGETVKGNVEYALTKTGAGMLKDTKDVLGLDQSDPRSQRQAQSANERLEELDQSGFAQYYNMYVAVSAASLEELEEEILLEKERLMTAGFGPVRISGSHLQLPAYMAACTGIDLL